MKAELRRPSTFLRSGIISGLNPSLYVCRSELFYSASIYFLFALQAKELPTFKDNDFLNEGHKLQIGDDNKKLFLEKLKRDVEVGSTWVFMGF